MAHYEEITIDQGSDVSIEVHLVNPDKSKKDLLWHSVSAKMSPSYNAKDSDKIPFTAIIADPAADGIVNLSLSNTVTDSLNPRKKYVYDVEVSFVDSDLNTIVERVLEGIIHVTPSVTK